MDSKQNIKRRKFLGTAAKGAAAFTIVPRHVLGKGYVPPSDKVVIANIGCGTQGIRELSDMLQNKDIHVKAVCDVNKYTTDYLDWSANGIINGIRNTLGDKNWGKYIKGIPGGRDIGQEYVEQYYSKNKASGTYKGCNSYEDFRELLEKEPDINAIKIMTPDHTHASIAMAAIQKGIHVVTHKPISNRLMRQWIKDGLIGELKEIHNWSYRPVWPQFPKALEEEMPIPTGFNWQLWLGPEKDRPYHLDYTHNVFRGWYDFGGGSIADMGHYSLFPLFRELGIETAPTSARAYGTALRTTVDQVCRPVNNKAAFPYSCMIKFQFPSQEILPAFDLFWYDGGMKPFAPEALEALGRDLESEGLLLVGDKGIILGGFEGENPELLPNKRLAGYQGPKPQPLPILEKPTTTWLRAIQTQKESPGSFRYAGPITETLNLGAVALRAGKRIEYDAATQTITNDKAANEYLTRDYRAGWEM